MKRTQGVEDLMLDSANNLVLRSRGETSSAQGHGLNPSHSPTLAVTQGSRAAITAFGGETEEK